MSNINYKQLGVSGLTRYGGYVYEEFLPNLRWPSAGNVYKEMADNDPVVGAVLYMAEMLIKKAGWSVEPVSDKKADIEAAEFLEECMHDMSNTFANTITDILSMLPYGFSFHEIVYKIRRGPFEKKGKYRSKYNDGKIGWSRMPIRAQSTLHEWEFADDGDIKAFVQLAPPYYKCTTIPLSKGLLFRTKTTRDNPEGRSLLRNAYRPWYFKKRIEEIEGIGIERDLAGLPVLTAPEGMDLWDTQDETMAALKANAEALIQGIRRDSEEGVLLPYGWDLKLLASGSTRQFNTTEIINRYDNRISITLLSDLVLIGGDKTGSFALADTKKSLLASALEAIIKDIAETMNKYAVPELIELNNFKGITGYPRMIPGEIETPSIKEVALLLRAMNLDITKDKKLQNYVRKVASMPVLSDKEFEELYAYVQEKATRANKDPVRNDTAERDLEQNDQAYTGQ